MSTLSRSTLVGRVGDRAWEIRWAERADRDVGHALDFLRVRSPRAAERWLLSIMRKVELLASQPEMGAAVLLDGSPLSYRRLVCGDYAVYYRLDDSARLILVVRVWHCAQNPNTLVL